MATRAHVVIAAATLASLAGVARAGSPGVVHGQRTQELNAMWQRAMDALGRASDALEPPLVRPVPVPVRWHARRAASLDLDAPLVDLAAGDVDGDGRAELVVLTTEELIVMHWPEPRKPAVRARLTLPGEPAQSWPRDPVGTLVVADTDGDGRAEIAARSSHKAAGAVFVYRDNGLAEVGHFAGFPLCPGVFAELAPGQNRFARVLDPEPAADAGAGPVNGTGGAEAGVTAPGAGATPTPATEAGPDLVTTAIQDALRDAGEHGAAGFFAARCRSDLVDPSGRGLVLAAVVDPLGAVHVRAERRCPRRPQGPCEPHAAATVTDHGVALAIGDVNRDGAIELAVTAATPPGDPDQVTVLSWTGETIASAYTRSFSGGVVGLAAGDVDGDGADDLVAAVRLWGSYRIDLWTFDN